MPADSAATRTVTGAASFAIYWEHAELVTLSVMALLLVLLLAELSVLIDGLLRQRVLARQARTVASQFWIAPNLYEALNRLEANSAYRHIAKTGLEAAVHRDGMLTDRIDTSEWIALSVDRAVRELSESLHGRAGALALIAPVAVATGLAGMTWTLACAGLTGQAPAISPELRIAEALLTGALSLVVAVTAAAGYWWLVQRNLQATGRVREFASAVRALLLNADQPTMNEGSGRTVPSPSRARMRAAVNAPIP